MIECDKCKAQMEQTVKEEHIPETEVEAYRKSMENFQKAIQKYQAQLRNNNKDKIKEYL